VQLYVTFLAPAGTTEFLTEVAAPAAAAGSSSRNAYARSRDEARPDPDRQGVAPRRRSHGDERLRASGRGVAPCPLQRAEAVLEQIRPATARVGLLIAPCACRLRR